MISSSANQKLGIAWPTTARNSAARSIRLLGQRPAATPSGTAVRIAKASPSAPTCAVSAKRSSSRSETGWLK